MEYKVLLTLAILKGIRIMGRPSKYSSAFKAKVALEALQGDVTLQELAQRYSMNPSKISEWQSELEKQTHQAFVRD